LHVFISHPALLHELCAFLERAECVVVRAQGHDVEVDIPGPFPARQARRELDIYLATWQVMNPGVEAYVVDRDRVA
jgi:hypothetical protein